MKDLSFEHNSVAIEIFLNGMYIYCDVTFFTSIFLMKRVISAETTKFFFPSIFFKSIVNEVLSKGDLISSRIWSLVGILILFVLANVYMQQIA